MGERLRYGDLSEVMGRLSPSEIRFEARRRIVGLFAGPLAFVVTLLIPFHGLSVQAARLAAVVAWVLVWWVTEAVPIPVTAVLGPTLAVIMGVGGVKALFAPFGNPIIFLFMGSFILAEAMSIHGLDRRIAFGILSMKSVGSSSTRIAVGFGVLAAGLSMWLSNSATTAMLYPIAVGVLTALSSLLSKKDGEGVDLTRLRYGAALMLVCAYASSIGGVATPVGTPPNLIATGFLDSLAHVRVPFFQWMLVALPITAVMLAVALVIIRVTLPPEVRQIKGSEDFIARERRKLGPWNPGERNVIAAFLIAVFLWVMPGVVAVAAGVDAPFYKLLKDLLPESAVAVLAASLLFVLPVDWKKREFTMTWNQAVRIDWGTLLLFGGGLSLGQAMFKTGLASAMGRGLTSVTGAHSAVSLTILFTVFAIWFTEVTSNTATATMLVPLAIAAAGAAGVSPLEPAIGCAIGCSMAFMLPVATPPNAIVYGSGCVRITQMVKIGFLLDVAASILVPAGVLIMVPLVLG